MSRALIDEYPEVIQAVRLFKSHREVLVRYQDGVFNEERFFYTDPIFFDVFTMALVQGDSKTALSQPNSLVISQSTAKRYFGEEDPIGKTISVDDKMDFKITAVAENVPANSHFHFDFLASFATLDLSQDPSWFNSCLYTYIVLPKDYPFRQLEAKFSELVRKSVGPQIQAGMGISIDNFFKLGNKFGFFLQPLQAIHLHSNLDFELEPTSDVRYVYIFSAIAVFILLVACINFMNLSTARSSTRAKEVGVRKVLGSRRSQLIRQFLTESILLSSAALLFALALVELILPVFNSLIGKKLTIGFSHFLFLPGIIGVILVVGIVAGSYPSFFLSAFQPATVMRGQPGAGLKSGRLRSVLVVSQFSISVILLIGTFIIASQLEYIRNKKLGFDKEHIVVIERAGAVEKSRQAFKNDLLKNHQVLNVTVSNYLPGRGFNMIGFKAEGAATDEMEIVNLWQGDHDFASTLRLEMAAGRFFSAEDSADSSIVINESAAELFGFEEPVGKHLMTTVKGQVEAYEVIGVVKDFHYESLHQKIRPMAIVLLSEGAGSYVSVRIGAENISRTLAFLKKTWQSFAPGQPFEYSFLDDDFDRLYRAEQRAGQLFTAFSVLAGFIACLGLFGLASFTAEQRTKEIGVRKILGASLSGIIALLSKDFLKWVLIANIIAWPVSYYAMNRWLQNFAYRISIGPWAFLSAALIALGIAILTVSFQSVRAALANPVDSLRYE
jgi:putative ABC transport system permease protein